MCPRGSPETSSSADARGEPLSKARPPRRPPREPRTFLFVFNCYLFIYLAALSLRCSARAFSSRGERGLLFIAVSRLLIAVASLAAEHGL